jgi:hypothetical protein
MSDAPDTTSEPAVPTDRPPQRPLTNLRKQRARLRAVATPRRPGSWLDSGLEHRQSDTVHNDRVLRRDSLALGVVNASSTFLPVLVARLGGSAFEIGLLTAIPAAAAVALAIPFGQILQSRSQIVRWYSTSRLIAYQCYGLIGIAIVLIPAPLVVPAILGVWALAAVPSTIGSVAFPVVMDGAAGPRGRMELMSRRWAIMGVTTAIAVALIGQVLDHLPFIPGYALVFVAFSLAAVASWWYSRQYRVTVHRPDRSRLSLPGRIRQMVGIVRGERPFLEYSARQLIYIAGVRLSLPLIPLFYVRTLAASDAWIGTIAMVQAIALLIGYLFWSRQRRTWGRAPVLLATMFVASIYPSVLSLIGEVAVVAVVAGVASVFAAGVDLALFDELMDRIPRTLGVTFTAIDTTLVNLATILAPLVAAVVVELMGIQAALRISTIVALAGVSLFALDIRAARRARPVRAAA